MTIPETANISICKYNILCYIYSRWDSVYLGGPKPRGGVYHQQINTQKKKKG